MLPCKYLSVRVRVRSRIKVRVKYTTLIQQSVDELIPDGSYWDVFRGPKMKEKRVRKFHKAWNES